MRKQTIKVVTVGDKGKMPFIFKEQDVSKCHLLQITVKPVYNGHSQKRIKIGFQDQLSLNTGQKYCRMLQGEHSAII